MEYSFGGREEVVMHFLLGNQYTFYFWHVTSGWVGHQSADVLWATIGMNPESKINSISYSTSLACISAEIQIILECVSAGSYNHRTRLVSFIAPFSSLSHICFTESYSFPERKSSRPGDESYTSYSRVPGELCSSLKPHSSIKNLPHVLLHRDRLILDFPPVNLVHFPVLSC